MRSFAKHLPHYLTLIGILFAGFCGLILFSYDKYFQLSVAMAVSVSYVSWGIVHHILHKDLSLEVFLEYVAVAAVGFIVIFSLIIRS